MKSLLVMRELLIVASMPAVPFTPICCSEGPKWGPSWSIQPQVHSHDFMLCSMLSQVFVLLEVVDPAHGRVCKTAMADWLVGGAQG